jgi:hypothetical protein
MSGSKDDDEVSPGGSKTLRYKDAPTGWLPPAPSTSGPEIEQHFEKYFGKPATVFHEVLSSRIHIDVHVIAPRPERNVWTLFTSGMSDLPMTTEPGCEALRFAELMLVLPPEWRIDLLKVAPPPPDLEKWYWPLGWLRTLARFPHDHRTWLGQGHTLPNGNPAKPFTPDTQLCAWLLLPPVRVPKEAREIVTADGRRVHVYVLHALHDDELKLKLDKGTNALLAEFSRVDQSEALIVDRPSRVRKKRFGIF